MQKHVLRFVSFSGELGIFQAGKCVPYLLYRQTEGAIPLSPNPAFSLNLVRSPEAQPDETIPYANLMSPEVETGHFCYTDITMRVLLVFLKYKVRSTVQPNQPKPYHSHNDIELGCQSQIIYFI